MPEKKNFFSPLKIFFISNLRVRLNLSFKDEHFGKKMNSVALKIRKLAKCSGGGLLNFKKS